jgi:hypothetical protein
MMHLIQKNHLPAICSEGGTLPRATILKNYLNSRVHIDSCKVDKLKKFSDSKLVHNAPLNKIISSQNQKLSQKIGGIMCTIYNDAKRGILSAWSWPSREITLMKLKNLNINNLPCPFEPNDGDL